MYLCRAVEYALSNMNIDEDNVNTIKKTNTISGLSIDYIKQMKPPKPRAVSALAMLTRRMAPMPPTNPDGSFQREEDPLDKYFAAAKARKEAALSHATEFKLNPVSTGSENAAIAPAMGTSGAMGPSRVFTLPPFTSAQTNAISRVSTQDSGHMNVDTSFGHRGYLGYSTPPPAVPITPMSGLPLHNQSQAQPFVQTPYQAQSGTIRTSRPNVPAPSSANSAFSNRDVTPSQIQFQNDYLQRCGMYPLTGRRDNFTSDTLAPNISTRTQPNSYSSAVMQSDNAFQLQSGSGQVSSDNYNINYTPRSNMNIRTRDMPNLTQMPNVTPINNANTNIHGIQNLAYNTNNLNIPYGSNLPNLPGAANVSSTQTLHSDNAKSRPVSNILLFIDFYV